MPDQTRTRYNAGFPVFIRHVRCAGAHVRASVFLSFCVCVCVAQVVVAFTCDAGKWLKGKAPLTCKVLKKDANGAVVVGMMARGGCTYRLCACKLM